MGSKCLAVVSVIGRDQKGVVARVSTHLASRRINIQDRLVYQVLATEHTVKILRMWPTTISRPPQS